MEAANIVIPLYAIGTLVRHINKPGDVYKVLGYNLMRDGIRIRISTRQVNGVGNLSSIQGRFYGI